MVCFCTEGPLVRLLEGMILSLHVLVFLVSLPGVSCATSPSTSLGRPQSSPRSRLIDAVSEAGGGRVSVLKQRGNGVLGRSTAKAARPSTRKRNRHKAEGATHCQTCIQVLLEEVHLLCALVLLRLERVDLGADLVELGLEVRQGFGRGEVHKCRVELVPAGGAVGW